MRVLSDHFFFTSVAHSSSLCPLLSEGAPTWRICLAFFLSALEPSGILGESEDRVPLDEGDSFLPAWLSSSHPADVFQERSFSLSWWHDHLRQPPAPETPPVSFWLSSSLLSTYRHLLWVLTYSFRSASCPPKHTVGLGVWGPWGRGAGGDACQLANKPQDKFPARWHLTCFVCKMGIIFLVLLHREFFGGSKWTIENRIWKA